MARTPSMISPSMLSTSFLQHNNSRFTARQPVLQSQVQGPSLARAPTNDRLMRLAHGSSPALASANLSVPPPGFNSAQTSED